MFLITHSAHKTFATFNVSINFSQISIFDLFKTFISKSILDDYLNNKISIREISKKYNISRQRLSRFFKSNNIDIDMDMVKLKNSIKLEDVKINSVISKYKSGKTIKEISEEEGLTIMITSRILHDSGVRLSNRFKDGKRYDGKQPKRD